MDPKARPVWGHARWCGLKDAPERAGRGCSGTRRHTCAGETHNASEEVAADEATPTETDAEREERERVERERQAAREREEEEVREQEKREKKERRERKAQGT